MPVDQVHLTYSSAAPHLPHAAAAAAAAAAALQVLERALPESADQLLALVMQHAAAGPAARFAAAQLIMIAATCVVRGSARFLAPGTCSMHDSVSCLSWIV
jgi:hypothetical protein